MDGPADERGKTGQTGELGESPPAAPAAALLDPGFGDWRHQLGRVVQAVREMSLQQGPQEMLGVYRARMRALLPFDRTVSLSRRGLAFPHYRITRSDLWPQQAQVDPWKHPEQLPLLAGGLFARLVYADEPALVDDLATAPDPDRWRLDASDPAAEHLAGMRSLVAIPHFDGGVGLNMVVHLRREPFAFRHEQFPELVLLSNLFGRAVGNLALTADLRAAQRDLQSQFDAVAELSDTVLHQAIELKRHAEVLEERVRQRTVELREANDQLYAANARLFEANLDAIYMLAEASEAKDDDTGRHVRRIQNYTKLLAAEIGLPRAEAEILGYASVLHDVGKIHVPDQILKKPGPLTPAERAEMQRHTVIGEGIISDREFFAPARRVARSHHENWDGSGYPDGLSAASIPLEARVVHLADVYDALTSPRVYKAAWSGYDAAKVIEESAGGMFDPDVVRAFASLVRRGEFGDKMKG